MILTNNTAPYIPEKLKFLYTDFKLVAESSAYREYEAVSKAKSSPSSSSENKHLIRILDSNYSDFVKQHFCELTTLFVQELLRLQQIYPSSVFIKTFGVCEENDGNQIFCATSVPYAHCLLLQQRDDDTEGVLIQQATTIPVLLDLKNPKLLSKLVSDVASELNFLSKELGL